MPQMSGISPKKIAADMRADAAAHHATVTSGNATNNPTVKHSTISFNSNFPTVISLDLRIYQEHVNKLMATLRNSLRSVRVCIPLSRRQY